MWTKQGVLGSLPGNRSHLVHSPSAYGKARCCERCARSAADAAFQPSVIFRATSGPTCIVLLKAKLRASSDMVSQSMSFVPAVAPVITGTATLAVAAAIKVRRSIMSLPNLTRHFLMNGGSCERYNSAGLRQTGGSRCRDHYTGLM